MPSTELSIREAPNYYVTEHFMYCDFICPCCDRIKLVPGFYKHVSLLERMRLEVGFPIVVTSGYRCKSHNARIGGAPRSWHLLFATDVRPEDNDSEKLMAMYDIAVELNFGVIGLYEAHMHIDLRPKQLQWRG